MRPCKPGHSQLAKVQLLAPFAEQYFGGDGMLDLPAGNLFALVASLNKLAPGFAEHAEEGVAFAVDGLVQPDWSLALTPDAEVVVFPRIAGG